MPQVIAAQRLGVKTMFRLEDARREQIFIVIILHRDGSLGHDGAVIELLFHEVHRAAADLHTMLQGLALGVKTGERGQQGRMDIENALRIGADELRRDR